MPLNYTQEDAYYHPAGIDQYKGDHELINQSERYFARVYLNPKRGAYHWTGLYAPPGELITVTIPEKAVGRKPGKPYGRPPRRPEG